MTSDMIVPPRPSDIHSGRVLALGEDVVWEGRPSGFGLWRHALYAPYVAAYFGGLTLLGCVGAAFGQAAWQDALAALGPGVLTLALLWGFAWLIARTTRYIITPRRVILRYGVAFPRALSLPFSQIAAMAVHVRADQRGDIALRLHAANHMPYLKLWPHARGWHLRHPQPMLRDIAAVGMVATHLSRSLAQAETNRAASGSGSKPDTSRDGGSTAAVSHGPPALHG